MLYSFFCQHFLKYSLSNDRQMRLQTAHCRKSFDNGIYFINEIIKLLTRRVESNESQIEVKQTTPEHS
jgi:hypothetical protein